MHQQGMRGQQRQGSSSSGASPGHGWATSSGPQAQHSPGCCHRNACHCSRARHASLGCHCFRQACLWDDVVFKGHVARIDQLIVCRSKHLQSEMAVAAVMRHGCCC